ncbi:hypothetical protein NBRC10513_007945 [Rhodotorula toruloides]|uniref:Uncharacterized protein n=1 Tax=Rhodotorula toruloides TaxID=5286 RepID=A0A0K3CG76_RHOTO
MGRNRLIHFLSFVDWNSNAWLASQLDAGWWNTLNDGEMSTMLAWAQTEARYARGESVHTQALEVPAFLQAKETALLAKEDARIPLTTEEDTELEVCNGLKTILREAHNQHAAHRGQHSLGTRSAREYRQIGLRAARRYGFSRQEWANKV